MNTQKNNGSYSLFDLVTNKGKGKEETSLLRSLGKKERRILEWEVYDYSAYGNMKPEFYFDEELGTIVNTKYVAGSKTQNQDICPYTYTDNNRDYYNFKPGDKSVNNVLGDFYKKYYNYAFLHAEEVKLPDGFNQKIENYNKHTLMEPYNILEEEDKLKLFFSINHRSKVFSNYLPMQDKTEFMIEELKDINKQDYAYTVLFFPSYDEDNNKTYGYLLGTLLVAYMLKNLPQNYDLTRQGKTGTKASVTCMVTPDVDHFIIAILELYYDDVIVVPYIGWSDSHLPEEIKNDPEKFIMINDVSKGNIDKQHAYSKVFTKINIFNKKLLNYKKVIIVDADLFPLGYYDSLFSLETPAGCIEHRRLQIDELGINSWSFDRGQMVKHGELIPKNLTDIENIYASDVNASLLIVEPNQETFDEMIDELQTPLDQWFGPGMGKEHKGFWLGNDFYNFYFLPEQNYLTKKFSGQWKSVDMGFSSWLIDIDNSFGFTFAGFTVKPWSIQSSFHRYSVNPYSTFSKINNQITQKAYGYQMMNHYIYKMFSDIKIRNYYEFSVLKDTFDMQIILRPFDPWEPEFVLNNNKKNLLRKIRDIDINDIKYLSYDQKKLVYMFNDEINKFILKKLLYFDYVLDNIGSKIYNLDFTALSYHLANIMYDVLDKESIKMYPFENTFLSVENFGSFDITSDDNDFLIVISRNRYREQLLNIIKQLLDMNLQVYVIPNSKKCFIQILQDENKPLYYYKDNTNKMSYTQFKEEFDFDDFKYFNISYYSPIIEKIIEDFNINMTEDLYSVFKKHQNIKVPWIDIHLIYTERCDKKHLIYEDNQKTISFNRNTFYWKVFWETLSRKQYIHILGRDVPIQHERNFIQEYYTIVDFIDGETASKILDNYVIYSKGQDNDDKKPVFKLSLDNDIHCDIVGMVYDFVNDRIKEKYDSIDIQKYLTHHV